MPDLEGTPLAAQRGNIQACPVLCPTCLAPSGLEGRPGPAQASAWQLQASATAQLHRLVITSLQ